MPDIRQDFRLLRFQLAQPLRYELELCPGIFQLLFRLVQFRDIIFCIGMIARAAQRAWPAVYKPGPFLLEVPDTAHERHLCFHGCNSPLEKSFIVREGFYLNGDLLMTVL